MSWPQEITFPFLETAMEDSMEKKDRMKPIQFDTVAGSEDMVSLLMRQMTQNEMLINQFSDWESKIRQILALFQHQQEMMASLVKSALDDIVRIKYLTVRSFATINNVDIDKEQLDSLVCKCKDWSNVMSIATKIVDDGEVAFAADVLQHVFKQNFSFTSNLKFCWS